MNPNLIVWGVVLAAKAFTHQPFDRNSGEKDLTCPDTLLTHATSDPTLQFVQVDWFDSQKKKTRYYY